MRRKLDIRRAFTGMKSSLRVQFTVLVTTMFALLALVLIGITTYADIRQADEAAKNQAQEISRTFANFAVHLISEGDMSPISQEVWSRAKGNRLQHLSIVGKDGKRLFSWTGQEFVHQDEHDHLKHDVTVDENLKLSLESSSDHNFSIRPVKVHGETVGAVLLLMGRPNRFELVRQFAFRNAIIAVIVLIFGMPLAFLFGHRILDPIHQLTQTAYKVSGGELDAAFPVSRNDEIGLLSKAYQEMVRTISANMERINHLAYVDPVTGLPNRTRFRSKLEDAVASTTCPNGAVLFIDLDKFKKVNDTYGHDVGDELLVAVAGRIKNIVKTISANDPSRPEASRYRPLLSRLGGDEFALLIPGLPNAAPPKLYAEQIVSELSQPISLEDHSVVVGASVGIALYPDDGTDISSLLKAADIAMYQAKGDGGNGVCFFDHDLDHQLKRRAAIESELRRAIANRELTVFYQPKVDCQTLRATGAEALIRWNHPVRGMVGPDVFISIAEESGLISDMGDFLLSEVCRQAIEWAVTIRPIEISVNISMAQLHRPDFAERTLKVIEESGIPHEILEFEVTESMAMTENGSISSTIMPLRSKGIRFAIDDFGTGYSSLSQLTRLPFDVFKIDRSFIDGVMEDQNSRVIVQTILAMAQSLNYKTVAEGIETAEQAQFLAEHGCTLAQGYYFGKPMPAKDFEAWLLDREEPTFRRVFKKAGGF